MTSQTTNEQRLAEAKESIKSKPQQAENLYKEVLANPPGTNEAALRSYEEALIGLGELYRDSGRANDLAELVQTSRSKLSLFAKAKTSKLGMVADPW